jgi:hypothetical protein
MLDKLNALGVAVDHKLVEPILARVKEEMRRLRRVLTDAEVRAIATAAAPKR